MDFLARSHSYDTPGIIVHRPTMSRSSRATARQRAWRAHQREPRSLTRIDDAGEPHLGFDPVAAKRAIRDHGFYAFELHAEERDGHD